MTRRRMWISAVAVAYFVSALAIGLWPTPVDAGLRGVIASTLNALHRDGVPGGFDYTALEFGANIAFFVPIGLLICLLLHRRVQLLAIPIGALFSGTIELSQLLLLPARYASWNDILANTIGTVIGVTIVVIVRGIRGARLNSARRATSATSAPG